MKTKVNVDLQPFVVPDFLKEVHRPENHRMLQPTAIQGPLDRDPNRYFLSEISAEDLEKLCEDFVKTVFQKAGKRRPPAIEARGEDPGVER